MESTTRNTEVTDATVQGLCVDSQTLLGYVWEITTDAMALSDADGIVLAANPAYLMLYGYTADQVIGRDFAIIFPEAARPDARQQYREVFQRATPQATFESTVCRSNGEVRHVETRIGFVESGGVRIAMLSSVRDVTRRWQAEAARSQAEQALRTLNEELEARVAERTQQLHAANEALTLIGRHKDEFMANMSHELRTPLTGILSFVEVLQQAVYGPLNDRQFRAVGMIEESSRHLLQLINDVLDMARVEAGKLELEMSEVEVADVARACIHVIAPLASAKRQNLSLKLRPTTLILDVDQRRLKQILVNLLSNAVKFTDEGGALGLEIVGDEATGRVEFVVWDNGIGIAPEQLPTLFRPFVQLDSSLNRQFDGSGLGLALVRRLAELHGGTVSVQSTPGAGSRFVVTLPWTAHNPANQPGQPHRAPRTGQRVEQIAAGAGRLASTESNRAYGCADLRSPRGLPEEPHG